MKYIKYGVIAFLSITVLLMIFFVVRGIKTFINPQYYVNTSSAAVVKELRVLNRYEVASFTIEKVIEAGTTQGNEFQSLLFGDKILLIAHGEVIAGFDLSKLHESNVQIQNATITITLPKPEILVSKLDNDKTRVYDRKLGLLTHGDQNLEAKARMSAEQSIQQAACQENILDEASKNARTQLTAMLKTLGFITVIINIPQGSCQINP